MEIDRISREKSSYLSVENYNKWKVSARYGEEIRQQMLIWIAKGIEERELKIMTFFDKYKAHPETVPIVSACVQRMMLMYRRLRDRYHGFGISEFPSHDCIWEP